MLFVTVAPLQAQTRDVQFSEPAKFLKFENQIKDLRYFTLHARSTKEKVIFDKSLAFNEKTVSCCENLIRSRQSVQTNSSNQIAGYVRPSRKERARRYINRVVGPVNLLGTLAFAGINHASDSPEEWEDDFKGYARRVGSSFGRNAIEETVIYALDESLRLDSTYYKKGKKAGFKERLSNALLSSVTARKPDGRRVIGFPRIIGVYTGSVVAFEVWSPNRFDYKDGLRNGTFSLGFNAALNVLHEFVLPGK